MLFGLIASAIGGAVASESSDRLRVIADLKNEKLIPYGILGFCTQEELSTLRSTTVAGYRPVERAYMRQKHGAAVTCAKCDLSSPLFTAGELRALEGHNTSGPIMKRAMLKSGVYLGPTCSGCRRPL